MTWDPPPYELDDDMRVCWTHGKVNSCRVGLYGDPDSCEWRTDDASVRAVWAYQNEDAEGWRDV